MDTATQDLRIPITLHVGLIGDRKLNNEEQLRAAVRKVIEDLDHTLRHTPHNYVIISSLAEGAAQVMAGEILKRSPDPGGEVRLKVVLPPSTEDFVENFDAADSRTRFYDLFNRAAEVQTLEQDSTHTAEEAVIQAASLIIAVWNGEKQPSLTSDQVDYARGETGRTLVWIDSNTGKITTIDGDDGTSESLCNLDSYNAASIDQSSVAMDAEAEFARLEALARDAELPRGALDALRGSVLPHFARADRLAKRYQRLYVMAGALIYFFAAAAVGTVTAGTLLFHEDHRWIWGEVAEITLILVVLLLSQWGDWLRKWIDYRFLAERLRATVFLFVGGLECEPPSPPQYLNISHRPNAWMVTAFTWICNCPLQQPGPEALDGIKKFTLKAWILDQKHYYEHTAHRLHRMHKILEWAGFSLFGMTALVAVMHAKALFPEEFEGVASLFAILLPAAGASVGGFRAYREYLRSSKQYDGMAKYLTRLSHDMVEASKMEELVALIKEADHVMTREHQGWRVMVFVHPTKETI